MGCRTGLLRGTFGGIIEFLSPSPRSKTGSREREKKAGAELETHLDWALANFSGYIAADELYDGPFCVLSVVDSREQRRLLYEVLDHEPQHADIRRFFQRLKDAIVARAGVLRGITTDGSPLYPEPISDVFGSVPHQLCEFHILKELTKAVLRVLARLRKQIAAQAPAVGRGRPSTTQAKRIVRRRRTIKQRVAELFEHRHLWVRNGLSTSQRKRLQRLTRAHPQLCALREIMDEVYRLFDRRCRTETALGKLARLRQRLKRFRSLSRCLDKLKSPNLEKALTFLDDKLLSSTSNAVERGNRRHRKMQKTVYRVRTHASIVSRVALDLQRDRQAEGRCRTTSCLHRARQKARSHQL